MKKSRPFLVWLAVLTALGFAAFNLARAVQAVWLWRILQVVLLVHPAYPLVSGLAWMLIGFGLALGLWMGWPNARRWALPIALAYSLYAWIDRLALPGYPERNLNWPFWAVVNGLALALVVWISRRRSVKTFFGDVHEQPLASSDAGQPGEWDRPQNPPTA